MTLTETVPQHMQALANANRIRLARSCMKRDIAAAPTRKDGLAAVAQILVDPPEFLGGMLVTELIAAAPRVGEQTALRWASFAELRRRRTIRDLTPGERHRILTLLARKVAP